MHTYKQESSLLRNRLSKIQKVIANFLVGRWLAASQEWNHWRFVDSSSEEVRHPRMSAHKTANVDWTDSKTSEKSCASKEMEIGATARGELQSLLLIVHATPSLNSDLTGEDF
jgi:hypothetical protein